jgi:hypothetical protein
VKADLSRMRCSAQLIKGVYARLRGLCGAVLR